MIKLKVHAKKSVFEGSKHINKERLHTTEKRIEKGNKVVIEKEEIGYIIDGLAEIKEKETLVDIMQHSPLTVKSNIQFNDKQVRMFVVIINNVN